MRVCFLLILLSFQLHAKLIKPHDFKPIIVQWRYGDFTVSSAEVVLFNDLIQNKKPITRDRSEAIKAFSGLLDFKTNTEESLEKAKSILYPLLMDRDYETYNRLIGMCEEKRNKLYYENINIEKGNARI
ncbi:MAG: hypothetical protein PHW04_18660 [Candidatus Wallbacteria bacterium]|nr:hypothetical protein [Candidatus Wallbacteria bacterium]